jgi:uncharacterized protein (TIGR03067 family)
MRWVLSHAACSLSIAFAAFAVDPPKEDATKEDVKKLQGKWQVIKWVDEGEKPAPADEIKDFTFEFKDDQVWLQHDKDGKPKPAKYAIDPSKKPKHFDYTLDLGKGLELLHQGIYKLEGDELSICILGDGENKDLKRPTEFKGSEAGRQILFVLKRIKKQ